MATIGFDNTKYLQEQAAAILGRISGATHKLYLEFGGKLLHDYHAVRVLPGYEENVKMQLMHALREQIDVILCIHAGAIEQRKMRADFGITYDADALKTIDELRGWDVPVRAVVITRYAGERAAQIFKNTLERRGIRVYTHASTKGYPADVDMIVSPQGYGANEYIETERPIVIVTGPGPGSGKLATCLSQLYHEHQRGVPAHYAKFETFPIWNLPLSHEVNVAYEAATAELRDVNMLDHFHLEACNVRAVNYNRDIEAFPLVRRILEKISGAPSLYRSPTEMGVNVAGFAIVDDAVVRAAARQELIRRYFRYACEYVMGLVDRETVARVELLMDGLQLRVEDRAVVGAARAAAAAAQASGKGNQGICCGAAIALPDGTLITGKNSPLLHAGSSLVLNTIKHLAGIADHVHLLPPEVIASVSHVKKDILARQVLSLDVEETLIALGISAAMNPAARQAVGRLTALRGCDVHMTHIPAPGDAEGLMKLGVYLTSEPVFASRSLYFT
jgi:uncharacterized protein (UPF0371 family)